MGKKHIDKKKAVKFALVHQPIQGRDGVIENKILMPITEGKKRKKLQLSEEEIQKLEDELSGSVLKEVPKSYWEEVEEEEERLREEMGEEDFDFDNAVDADDDECDDEEGEEWEDLDEEGDDDGEDDEAEAEEAAPAPAAAASAKGKKTKYQPQIYSADAGEGEEGEVLTQERIDKMLKRGPGRKHAAAAAVAAFTRQTQNQAGYMKGYQTSDIEQEYANLSSGKASMVRELEKRAQAVFGNDGRADTGAIMINNDDTFAEDFDPEVRDALEGDTEGRYEEFDDDFLLEIMGKKGDGAAAADADADADEDHEEEKEVAKPAPVAKKAAASAAPVATAAKPSTAAKLAAKYSSSAPKARGAAAAKVEVEEEEEEWEDVDDDEEGEDGEDDEDGEWEDVDDDEEGDEEEEADGDNKTSLQRFDARKSAAAAAARLNKKPVLKSILKNQSKLPTAVALARAEGYSTVSSMKRPGADPVFDAEFDEFLEEYEDHRIGDLEGRVRSGRGRHHAADEEEDDEEGEEEEDEDELLEEGMEAEELNDAIDEFLEKGRHEKEFYSMSEVEGPRELTTEEMKVFQEKLAAMGLQVAEPIAVMKKGGEISRKQIAEVVKKRLIHEAKQRGHEFGEVSDAEESGEEDEENLQEVEVKQRDRWDCETIVSTYSNLENHPSLIKESSRPKKRIELSKKTGMPLGVLDHNQKQQQAAAGSGDDEDDEDDEDSLGEAFDDGPGENFGKKRAKNESKEEKKNRKLMAKEMKRMSREAKKELKSAFKEEEKKQTKMQAMPHTRQKVVIKYA